MSVTPQCATKTTTIIIINAIQDCSIWHLLELRKVAEMKLAGIICWTIILNLIKITTKPTGCIILKPSTCTIPSRPSFLNEASHVEGFINLFAS